MKNESEKVKVIEIHEIIMDRLDVWNEVFYVVPQKSGDKNYYIEIAKHRDLYFNQVV